jgi:uncharacterized protein
MTQDTGDLRPAVVTRRALALGLTATLSRFAHAQDGDRRPPGFALVIGNSDYDGDGGVDTGEQARLDASASGFASDLRNAGRDAELVGRTLRSAGFDVTQAMNCDRGMMFGLAQSMRARAEAASETPRIIIYFAGHGLQLSGRNYLVPARAQLLAGDVVEIEDIQTLVESRCLPVQQLLISSNRPSAPGYSLLLLDACRDNPWEPLFAERAAAANRTYTERGLNVMSAPSRRVLVSYASSPGGVAMDGDALNGPYASALARWLRNGQLPIDTALSQVSGEVFALTSGRQTPWVSGQFLDETRF